MYNYEVWKAQWYEVLNKLESTNAEIEEVEFDEPATIEEVKAVERKLNVGLPPSYRNFILNISRNIRFSWTLPEEDMERIPEELGEIFSGELYIDFSKLEDLTKFAEEWYEDGVDYGVNWRNKIALVQANNGDIYAFDYNSKKVEKPIVYIQHDDDGIYTIADSFVDYLEKITQLYYVGNEIWQLEAFLDEEGLNVKSEQALKWMSWFEGYTAKNDQK